MDAQEAAIRERTATARREFDAVRSYVKQAEDRLAGLNAKYDQVNRDLVEVEKKKSELEND